MTVPDEKLIRAEMAVALEMLDDAEDSLRKERFRSAVSRGYYAVYHAARAVLASRAIGTVTHKGLIQQFGDTLVRSGEVEREFGRILTDAHDDRQLADYNVMTGSFEKVDIERQIANARKFVERMQELL